MTSKTVKTVSIYQNDMRIVRALKITLISVIAIEIIGGFANLTVFSNTRRN